MFAIYDADDGAKLAGPDAHVDLFERSAAEAVRHARRRRSGRRLRRVRRRWVISQFALNFNAGKFAECIAVSETERPDGRLVAYQFDYPNADVLNDYPKFGVWLRTTAYYASFNQFRCNASSL